MIDYVRYITKDLAVQVIDEYHYSKVLPKINKFFIGGYSEGELVAICTLGYGVQPLHTIKKIFPNLGVKDYFEIGKLCVSDAMPRNTESNFISKVIKLIKENHKEVKLLYSWADGIIGKPGYVYQCSNFFYGGYIWTEMYLDKNGVRVHPRTLQGLTGKTDGKFGSRSYEVTEALGFKKYFGKQFRYVYPLCSKGEWKHLKRESTVPWDRNGYPKETDCLWKHQLTKGKREFCDMPEFVATTYTKNHKENELGNIITF